MHTKATYEALIHIKTPDSRLEWIPTTNGNIPYGAIPVGWDGDFCVPTYIGATTINSNCQRIVVGHIDPGTLKLSYTYECGSHVYHGESSEYDVLVYRQTNIEPDEYKVK